ncbi:hypothetical protein D3C75_885570 [compost metagenome]
MTTAMLANTFRPCSRLSPWLVSGPLAASSGTNAISGMAAMSWNSRMANARRPCGALSCLLSARLCRPRAVDDSARPRPSTMAAGSVWLKPNRAMAPISAPVSSTWAVPTPNTDLRISHRRLGDSSRPMMNSSRTTPSSEMCATLSVSRIRPSACGPMITPASR